MQNLHALFNVPTSLPCDSLSLSVVWSEDSEYRARAEVYIYLPTTPDKAALSEEGVALGNFAAVLSGHITPAEMRKCTSLQTYPVLDV